MKCLSNSTAQVDKTVNATLFSFRFKDITGSSKCFIMFAFYLSKVSDRRKQFRGHFASLQLMTSFLAQFFPIRSNYELPARIFPHVTTVSCIFLGLLLPGSFDITASTLIGQSIRVVDQLGTGISPF